MRKIRLQLESLEVDSFDTTARQRAGGTVHVHEQHTWETVYASCDTCFPTCPFSCDGSCDSCVNTCGESCYGTCFEDTCDESCGGTCLRCGPLTADTCARWCQL